MSSQLSCAAAQPQYTPVAADVATLRGWQGQAEHFVVMLDHHAPLQHVHKQHKQECVYITIRCLTDGTYCGKDAGCD